MRDAAGRKIRHAGLADYAAVSRGLLDWAAVAGDSASRRLAKTLVETAWQRFYQSGGWKLAPLTNVQALVADGVSPSPVSLLLQVNRRLGRQAPLSHSQVRMALLGAPSRLLQQPLAYASYLSPLQRLTASGE
jgi:uncharacterized protein YyaL (SSP411 family)